MPISPYWQTTDRHTIKLYQGDSLKVLRGLPSESVHMIVTSPPYWSLRDYQTGTWEGGDPTCTHQPTDEWLHSQTNQCSGLNSGPDSSNSTQKSAAVRRWYRADGSCRCGARRTDEQLGAESTPEEYVEKLVLIFREARRVLRKDGTVWLNLGDTYSGGKVGRDDAGTSGGLGRMGGNLLGSGNVGGGRARPPVESIPSGNLIGIPWRVAFALQADGWILRQEIIWAKASPMPESVTNRCTKAHEQIFLLSKSQDYYFDTEAIKEPISQWSEKALEGFWKRKSLKTDQSRADGSIKGGGNYASGVNSTGRNKRSVWSIEDEQELYNWLASAAPEVLAEFLMRHERCGEEHEHISLLAKENSYYFDNEAIKEPALQPTGPAHTAGKQRKQEALDPGRVSSGILGTNQGPEWCSKRSVWNVAHGGGYKGSHFATYPPKLIEPCILAGTSAVGCCPECGALWTRVIEKKRVVTRPGTDSKTWRDFKAPGRKDVIPGQLKGRACRERLSAEEVGNRDPLRHVTENRTIGWRPGCRCYRLQLIGEQPSQPQQGIRETEEAFQKRHDQWESRMQEWLEDWKALKPLYEKVLGVDEGAFAAADHITDCQGTVPCTVLDPFIGSGTTALVSLSLGRRCVGIDLSEEYLKNHCVERVKATLLSRPGTRHLIDR